MVSSYPLRQRVENQARDLENERNPESDLESQETSGPACGHRPHKHCTDFPTKYLEMLRKKLQIGNGLHPPKISIVAHRPGDPRAEPFVGKIDQSPQSEYSRIRQRGQRPVPVRKNVVHIDNSQNHGSNNYQINTGGYQLFHGRVYGVNFERARRDGPQSTLGACLHWQ